MEADEIETRNKWLARLQTDGHNNNKSNKRTPLVVRRLTPLESAIVNSISQLSYSNPAGVHINQLIAHLESRYAHKVELPTIEYIDCAIGGLVKCARLRLSSVDSAFEANNPPTSANSKSLFSNQLLHIQDTLEPVPRAPSTTASSKSKSTTLDSGIQSWDLASNQASETGALPESTNSPSPATAAANEQVQFAAKVGRERAERRRFSLSRSLSLRPKKDRWPSEGNAARTINQAGQEQATLQSSVARTTIPAVAQQLQKPLNSNLSSLFRSRSMRAVPSSASRARDLSSDRMDSRSGAGNKWTMPGTGSDLRGNSVRASNWLDGSLPVRNSHTREATIDYLAQPQKRSLSIRRHSLLTFNQDGEGSPSSGQGKILLFLRKLFTMRRSRSKIVHTTMNSSLHERCLETTHMEQKLNCNHITVAGDLSWPAVGRYDNQATPSTVRPCNAAASNNNSNNKDLAGMLRKQQTVGSQTNSNRMLPQQNSPSSPTASSSSGTNSLIEILDCSPAVRESRRVLREENAISASANRATWRLLERSDSSLSHHSATSNSTTKSTVSQQLRRHLDEAYKRHRNCTNQREKDFIDSINVLRQASRHALQNSTRSSSKTSRQTKSTETKSPTSEEFSSESSTSPNPLNGADHYGRVGSPQETNQPHDDSNSQHSVPHPTDLIFRGQQEVAASKCLEEQEDSTLEPLQPELPDSLLCESECCICASYLSAAASSRLCPLACWNPTCCLPPVAASHANQDHRTLPRELQLDFCCPIWRSMLYNCCPATAAVPPPPPPSLQHQPPQSLYTAEIQVPQVEDYSLPASRRHHLQQHSTTIDLKIEIGADFQKKLDQLSGSCRRLATSELDDSLDSYQTDESLACSSSSSSGNSSSGASDGAQSHQQVLASRKDKTTTSAIARLTSATATSMERESYEDSAEESTTGDVNKSPDSLHQESNELAFRRLAR